MSNQNCEIIEVVQQNPFFYCKVSTKVTVKTNAPKPYDKKIIEVFGYGFTKCSSQDEWNAKIGYEMALTRAKENMWLNIQLMKEK